MEGLCQLWDMIVVISFAANLTMACVPLNFSQRYYGNEGFRKYDKLRNRGSAARKPEQVFEFSL